MDAHITRQIFTRHIYLCVYIQGVKKFDVHNLTSYKAIKTTLCGALKKKFTNIYKNWFQCLTKHTLLLHFCKIQINTKEKKIQMFKV